MQPTTELIGPKNTRFPTVTIVKETESTNADLLSLSRKPGNNNAVLIAEHQTQGRGRQDRTWGDEPGRSLLISILLQASPELAAVLPFATALAVKEMLSKLGSDNVDLKWPNDVLIEGAKLAGILVEARSGSSGVWAVIGCGINLASFETSVNFKATSLEETTGHKLTVATAANYYLLEVESQLRKLEKDSPALIVSDYKQHCVTLGNKVRVSDAAGEEIIGTAADLGPNGELVVEMADQELKTVLAGDAHLI